MGSVTWHKWHAKSLLFTLLLVTLNKIWSTWFHKILSISCDFRILTGKKHPHKNYSAYEKYGYEHLGNWYIKSTFYQRFLNWSKTFKKKVVMGKIPFFVKGLLCIFHSICLNISFCHGSFVWKWCVFTLNTFYWKTRLQFFEKGFPFPDFFQN